MAVLEQKINIFPFSIFTLSLFRKTGKIITFTSAGHQMPLIEVGQKIRRTLIAEPTGGNQISSTPR